MVGVSLGGWIAAEMAVKSCARLSRETRDIADIFAMTDGQFAELAYFDPSLGKHDYKAMPEAEVRAVARSREATARYGWSPYMHDPKLKQRLHRIRVPTLVLWGTADRIVSKPYGRAYGAAILGAHAGLVPDTIFGLERRFLAADRLGWVIAWGTAVRHLGPLARPIVPLVLRRRGPRQQDESGESEGGIAEWRAHGVPPGISSSMQRRCSPIG